MDLHPGEFEQFESDAGRRRSRSGGDPTSHVIDVDPVAQFPGTRADSLVYADSAHQFVTDEDPVDGVAPEIELPAELSDQVELLVE